MSEQNKSSLDSWRSKPAETPKPKLSRRGFLKGAVLGGIGLGGAVYSGLKFLEGLGLELPHNSFEQELQALPREATPTPFQPRETTPASSTQTPEATPEPSPTPEAINYWAFAKADFSDSEHLIDMMITLRDSSSLLVPSFIPISWHDGLQLSVDFDRRRNTGLTYLDEDRRKILNLHSGREGPLHSGYTMWETQLAIETDGRGNRIYPAQADEKLRTQFMGADVLIRQTEAGLAKIVAAVRVPPSLVYESTQHVYEETDPSGSVTNEGIIPWLAANFPDSGFADVVNDREVLIIKFCGRILSGEREDTRIDSPYQQARFFFALKQS
ncbi:hypothetical protein A2Y68_01305 [Candidatus Woesebacteria bacterium RBG_13_46_13]|uniref:Twin-arginine translocation signal domain-containing protein n=1 Tax=Candidatus Woesebacteria bacterium RBG_13_46_13 TaxID=1802479 RepID=A0A1F7X4P2_9BACT|nr:MAG: hypothetical protein A2Y68_01305 [Candidatus Woesebacteria bacterium RBG_13_46_13]